MLMSIKQPFLLQSILFAHEFNSSNQLEMLLLVFLILHKNSDFDFWKCITLSYAMEDSHMEQSIR